MNRRPKLIKKLCTLTFLLATLSIVNSNSVFALVSDPVPERDCDAEYNSCMTECGGQPGCDYHCEDLFILCIHSQQ